MIIDSLTHVTPNGRWFDTPHDASVDRLLREMDKANIDKAVVVALADYIENDFVLNICKNYNDRLIPGLSINPASYSSSEKAILAIRSLINNEEFVVLKLHPRLNGYDPLDLRCLSILEEIASHPKPMHLWLDTLFRNDRCLLKKGLIDTIHELAFRFPDIQFILLHGTGPNLLELSELVGRFDNLIIDLSLTLLYYNNSSISADIQFILQKRDQRTIVGSDFPEYKPLEYINMIKGLASEAGCSQKNIDNVLGHNLLRLFS